MQYTFDIIYERVAQVDIEADNLGDAKAKLNKLLESEDKIDQLSGYEPGPGGDNIREVIANWWEFGNDSSNPFELVRVHERLNPDLTPYTPREHGVALIVVEGGMADIRECRNCDLALIDYDVDGVDEHDLEHIDGNPCTVRRVGHTEDYAEEIGQ